MQNKKMIGVYDRGSSTIVSGALACMILVLSVLSPRRALAEKQWGQSLDLLDPSVSAIGFYDIQKEQWLTGASKTVWSLRLRDFDVLNTGIFAVADANRSWEGRYGASLSFPFFGPRGSLLEALATRWKSEPRWIQTMTHHVALSIYACELVASQPFTYGMGMTIPMALKFHGDKVDNNKSKGG